MSETIDRTDTVHRSPAGAADGNVCVLRRCMLLAGVFLHPLREGCAMTLQELSRSYEEAAVPLRARLKLLRQLLTETEDPEEIWHIKRRIAELTPMLTQMNELAELTAHYYERGYYRSEKYTL